MRVQTYTGDAAVVHSLPRPHGSVVFQLALRIDDDGVPRRVQAT